MGDSQTISVVKAVWEDVLDLQKGSCADEDHFWLLGGNSLTMLRVLARMHRIFGFDLNPAEITAYSTPRKLALMIEQASMESDNSRLPAGGNVICKTGKGVHEGVEQKSLNNQPLSLQQQALWYEENRSFLPLYNNGVSWHIRSAFQIGLFAEAFNAVLARHEILRSSFHPDVEAKALVHRVLPSLTVQLMEEAPEDDPERLCQMAMETRFDMGRAPLFRLFCLRLAPQHVQVVLIMHHSITDGWSGNELTRELWSTYRALEEKRAVKLTPVAGYGAYCRKQQHLLRQKGFSRAADYWLRRLQGITMPRSLTFGEESGKVCEHAEYSTEAFRAEVFTEVLDSGLCDILRNACCITRQCSLFELCCTAHVLLLILLRNEQDLVIGVPVANRRGNTEMHSQGLFVNTLPFRTTVQDELSLQELLQSSINNLRNDLQFQHMPLSLIAELVSASSNEAQPDSADGLFQEIFVYQNFSCADLAELTGLDIEIASLHAAYCHYPLNLEITERAGNLIMTWQYHRLRYTQRRVAGMQRLYTDILKGLAFTPDLTLAQFRKTAQADSTHITD